MTGNKPGSHKAIKKTRSSVTKDSINSKRQLNLATPLATITAVTQTQGDGGAPVPVTASPHVANPLSALLTVSSRLLSSLESLVADGDAISDMVSGLPLRCLDYIQTGVLVTTGTTTSAITQEFLDNDDNSNIVLDESVERLQDHETTAVDEGTITPAIPPTNGLFPLVQKIALSKFKKKTGRISAFKLTAQSVHNALRSTPMGRRHPAGLPRSPPDRISPPPVEDPQ
jgi:hypothetical protein